MIESPFFRSLVLVLLLCLTPACGGEDEPSAPSAGLAMTEFYLSNTSGEPVNAVYLRESGTSDWGENWLRSPIRPGNWYGHIGRVESGNWDVRMVGSVREITETGFPIVGSYLAISFH